MGFKLTVERLVKEELQYELIIRGLPADDLVKNLRATLRKANSENIQMDVQNPFPFEDDVVTIQSGINLIKKLITALEISPAKESACSLETKLTHYANRADKANAIMSEDEVLKIQLNVDIAVLIHRCQLLLNKSEINVKENFDTLESDKILENSQTTNCSFKQHEPVRNVVVKSTPVLKWGLKFSGEPRSLSISAFLERVDELVIARKVDHVQLLEEAVDLFTSKALIWFRANRNRVNTWTELVALLNTEFCPIDYDDRLLEEIKRRTQGLDETMSMFISVMKTMFTRLLKPLPEEKQLRIVLRNLTPFHQNQLGLMVITSFDQLLTCGRTIEERRFAIESYVPPSRKKNDLEVDLAYLNLKRDLCEAKFDLPTSSASLRGRDFNRANNFNRGRGRGVTRGNANTAQTTIVNRCWNRSSTDHFASRCSEPQRQMYCYCCGCPGVTTRTCSTYSKNQNKPTSENSEGRH